MDLVLLRDGKGRTALYLAAFHGHEAAARMLIKAGGKELLFKTDNEGCSALPSHVAAQNGHTGVSKVLVEEGGKDLVLIMANDGRTVLHFAAHQGHEETVLLLIETGGEDLPLVTDTDGDTALHSASLKGHVEVARLLIGAGGQRLLSLIDKDGWSPLYCAADHGHVDLSRLLVDRGGKRLLAAKAILGQTAEDVATLCGHGALAGMLRRARVAEAGSDVWGQARFCVLVEEEALAVARAAAAMAELLAGETKPCRMDAVVIE